MSAGSCQGSPRCRQLPAILQPTSLRPLHGCQSAKTACPQLHCPRPCRCSQSSRLLPMQLLQAVATCPGAAGAGRALGDNGARGSGSAPESPGEKKSCFCTLARIIYRCQRGAVCAPPACHSLPKDSGVPSCPRQGGIPCPCFPAPEPLL